MAAVLGIDAAWTQTNQSGFALVESGDDGWILRAAAPSLGCFARAAGLETESPSGLAEGLACARRLLGGRSPDLIAVDMPLSKKPITGRRASDDMVSKCFGAAKCGTHSPSATRPGDVSVALLDALEAEGYSLVVVPPPAGALSLAEVYPHPALLRLMGVPERFPYKVGKTGRYWKTASAEARLAKVKDSLESIVERLEDRIGGVAGRIGAEIANGQSFSALKPVEDMIDAIVSAWVGIAILEGDASPIGDEVSAIWVPNDPPPASPGARASS
jgi:predicted RNase H-like nuclease